MRELKLSALEGACKPQRVKFKKLFGKKVIVTEELAIKHAQDFDWGWAANSLLSATAWVKYKRVRAPAREEYDKANATAWAKYSKAKATAWAKYDRSRAPVWAKYSRAIATAWAEYKNTTTPAREEYSRAIVTALEEYNKAEEPARAECNKAMASAFAKAYIGDGETK
jgi:hypothetical protein